MPSLGFRLAGSEAGTRATSVVVAGLSAGTVIGLPAGQFFGNLIGWRPTFAGVAGVVEWPPQGSSPRLRAAVPPAGTRT